MMLCDRLWVGSFIPILSVTVKHPSVIPLAQHNTQLSSGSSFLHSSLKASLLDPLLMSELIDTMEGLV